MPPRTDPTWVFDTRRDSSTLSGGTNFATQRLGRCGLRGWAPVLKTGWPSGPGSTPSPSTNETTARGRQLFLVNTRQENSGFDSLSFHK